MKGLVEEKVNIYRLGVYKDETELKELTEKSPSLKELQNGAHRVKALSKMFENKVEIFGKKDSTGKPKSFVRRISIELEAEKPTNLQRTVLELIHTEETYIHNLEHGIKNFVQIIKDGGVEVPTSLHHQANRLFGNIDDILKFNKNFFHRLIKCGKNVRAIAELFTNLIQDEYFYCYVVYNVNYKNVELMITTYLDFFKKTFNGRLGIESFLIQPVQRLPRYQLILCAMIKELSKDLTNTDKTSLAACCIAEKNMQRLLTRCNEGMMIHDIVETREVSVQLGILATMQTDHGLSQEEPELLLIPRACSYFPMRRPVSF